jgi:pyruvoyl-dependent arginine decarboxylase (PvlArgDC)
MKTITWKAGEIEPENIRGKTFEGGRPDTMNGVRVVRFERPRVGGKTLAARIDTRPALAALVAEYDEEKIKEQNEREARRAAEQAKQDAIDKPLLAEMDSEAARLRGLIPADSVEVQSVKTGYADGDPIMEHTAEGVEVSWGDIVVHGHATAIRPGALGAFASVCIASIPRAKLEGIKQKIESDAAEKKAKTEKAEADRAAKFMEAARTGKPVELRRWTETRRAKEGGEWGDYIFICVDFAQPDGTVKTAATNCY